MKTETTSGLLPHPKSSRARTLDPRLGEPRLNPRREATPASNITRRDAPPLTPLTWRRTRAHDAEPPPLLPSFSFLQAIEVCLDLLVAFVRHEICRTSFESIPARSTAETTTNTLLQLFGFYFPCLEFVPLWSCLSFFFHTCVRRIVIIFSTIHRNWRHGWWRRVPIRNGTKNSRSLLKTLQFLSDWYAYASTFPFPNLLSGFFCPYPFQTLQIFWANE